MQTRAGITAVWLCLLLACAPLLRVHGQAAFLQEALPLKPLAATPVELLEGGSAVTLTGRQAITAVFSRPVIALGSDFGQQALPANLVPFTLTCNTPGRLRWVTTNIARFDPSVDWPTDLACAFVWNQNLKTYDGAPLQLGSAPPRVTLSTESLSMSLDSVASELANQATDDLWSATVGLPSDGLPEVPPDGNITLSFSYPIELSKLQASLRVTGASNIAVKVTPCPPPITYYPIFVRAGVAAQPTTPANTTCAVVRLNPALGVGQAAALELPAGARYNSLAGPLGKAQSVKVFGLRRFRVPLRQDFQVPRDGQDIYDGVQYRRLSLWLPHGLAKGTPVTALAPLITICATGAQCAPLPFTIKLVSKGQAQMNVPGLMPKVQYSISVKASSEVKDAFGLGLEALSTKFWTRALESGFEGPTTTTNIALLETTPGNSPLTWPFVSRGAANGVNDADSWELSASGSDAARMMYLTTGWDFSARDAFGTSGKRISRAPSTSPTFENLTLSGKPGIQAVATCCRTVNYPTTRAVSAKATLVVTSDLQAAFVGSDAGIVAWVTSARGSSAPVAGAKVQLYTAEYENSGTKSEASKGPSCTTSDDGTCTIAPSTSGFNSGQTGALIDAGDKGVLVVARVPFSGTGTQAAYQGSIVLDRALVRPGDELHVTAYIQRQEGASLKPPTGLSTATLQITPNFDSAQNGPLTLSAPLDPTFGSLHSTVKVPPNSAVGAFTVSLLVPGGSGGGQESIESAAFTVSDPRPPTAELKLTVPPWVRPTASVPVSLTANSYLGSPLPSALITIDWSTPEASGSLNTTTDAKGAAAVKLELGQLPAANRSSAGEQLSVTATYIGPTRERIVQTATSKIADGPTRVTLNTTLTTDLPNTPFGVAATAFSNTDDSQLPSSTLISITLLGADEKDALKDCSAAQKAALASQKCTVASGSAAEASKCQLLLPCKGRFALRGCVDGGASCSNVTLGRNASDWESAPWVQHPATSLLTDKAVYGLGESVTLYGQNAGYGPTSGLLVWGNALAKKQLIIKQVPKGPFTAKIGPLGEECRGGCSAVLVLAVARPGSSAGIALPGVPTSLLFDPFAPHTLQATVTLTVLQNKPLSVSVSIAGSSKTSAGLPVVAPGASAPITVTVTGDGAAGAEVTLIAVDKAVLDLVPYALQNVSSTLQPSVSTYYSVTDINGLRLQRPSLEAVFEALRRRLALDPALPLETGVSPYQPYSWGAGNVPVSPVDVPDGKYLDGYTSAVTVFPPTCYNFGRSSLCPYPLFLADSVMVSASFAAAPMAAAATLGEVPKPNSAAGRASANNALAKAGTEGMAAASASSPRLQSGFKTTPLFRVLKASTNGGAGATFDAPPNLGAFVVRAYVASDAKNAGPTRYGSGHTELVVRRPLSLTPSVPRAVRIGDSFQAGVLVSAPGVTGSETVTVTVSLGADSAALALTGSSSQKVTLTAAQQQQEVRFKFIAKSIGNASVTFAAAGAESASDGLVLSIPVLGRQGDVYVATSFAVRGSDGNGTGSRNEGLVLPGAEPGSGSVDLLAGVGYMPAIEATYKSLLESSRTYAEGAPAMALATLPSLLALYHPGQAASQWLSTTQQQAIAQAFANLTKLSDSTYGLLPLDPSQGPWFTPTRADITLNSWAAWLAKQATPPTAAGSLLSEPWSKVVSQAGSWKAAAGRQLVKDAEEARAAQPPGQYSDLETLSWARLALGGNWVPEGASQQIIADLAMSRLTNAVTNLTTGAQTRVALTLLEQQGQGQQQPAAVKQVVRALTSAVRVGGRTAYVASGLGARSAAGLSDQALALLLFVRTGLDAPATNPLIQKLAAYVAQGPQRSNFWTCFVGTSAFEGALQGLALSAYDAAGNSTNPSLDLSVSAGPKTLLSAQFTPANAGTTANSSTPWDAIPPSSTLQFTAKGSGEVSVAASLHFVPSALLPYPQYRGLWVQRAVQLAGAGGGNLASAPLASSITMIVQVTSPDDLGQVTVEVMMPGGLEPLDPNIYGDSGAATTCGFSQDETNDLVPPPKGGPIIFGRPFMGATAVGSSGVNNLVDGMPKGRRLLRQGRGIISDDGGSSASGRSLLQAARGISGGSSSSSSFLRIFPPWLRCPAQATRPSVVTFTYSSLSAGTHTIAFQAIAATSGTFTLPPVKAYANNQPELMGLSPAGNLTICSGSAACGSGSAGPAVAPKACPGGCSSNGVCDLASGRCACNEGFSGADCAKFSG